MKRCAVILTILAACGGEPAVRTPEQRAEDTAPSLVALRDARFTDARRLATSVLATDPRNARAAAVRAIARYEHAGDALLTEIEIYLRDADRFAVVDHEGARAAWKTFLRELDAVDADLAVAGADPAFSLELCLACWEHDWNRQGGVDDRDRRLFEIEVDQAGVELPAGDPRRRPTFRFDVGDIDWARAMISFQRAGTELVLAYRWNELEELFEGDGEKRITVHLAEPARVRHARALFLEGLAAADRCRAAYLAETDDDREWVPSPRQHDHAVPLPVDAALYATWAGITGDLRRMLDSEEGIGLREAAMLIEPKAALLLPDAFIDLGAMFREPTDIVIDFSDERETPRNVERILRGLLGHGYATGMRSSPLVGRLRHMKEQVEGDEETVSRKLRYLFWLN